MNTSELSRFSFYTATALPKNSTVTEFAPCEPLKPIVRCFWTSNGAPCRIIPDCCGGIVIPLQPEKEAFYCGMNNRSFLMHETFPLFGIRFFAWTAKLFTPVNGGELFNNAVPAREIFFGFDHIEAAIKQADNIQKRIAVAQNYLLKTLHPSAFNASVMNALYFAVRRDCRVSVSDLTDYCAVGKRTLERNFIEYTGTNPKQMIDLCRYQLLWREALRHDFDVLNCVERFGYYDEAHLYKNFKLYHGVNLTQARQEYASLSHFYNTNP